MSTPIAVIVAAGSGLSAALAREFASDHDLVLAARGGTNAQGVANELDAPVVQREGIDETAGAFAGVKGVPLFAPFAMGKFAHRGLAESMARELHPKGIQLAWINIDGAILNPGNEEPADKPGSMLRPEAIAQTYRHTTQQDRSAWSRDVNVGPWVEKF